jgi:hypothetical protein
MQNNIFMDCKTHGYDLESGNHLSSIAYLFHIFINEELKKKILTFCCLSSATEWKKLVSMKYFIFFIDFGFE